MVSYFEHSSTQFYAVAHLAKFSSVDLEKLIWLFGDAKSLDSEVLDGSFIGPRKEMITPWSTNAVEITQNMGMVGISRIEEFYSDGTNHDPMLQAKYDGLDQSIFSTDRKPEPVLQIENIAIFNQQEGLALSEEEIIYLEGVSKELSRLLTDSEVFGFSQVNSEHCRHKIFNGQFIIDGKEKEQTLFQLIKKTSKENPQGIVSAYKDNVAFIDGPKAEQFAPASQNKPDFFETKDFDSVISIKAETHNFPTTVEPFNGAATGAGGEIRDRLAGGKASIPLAGTAVYMTSYSRLEEGRSWESETEPRSWLYQTPLEILIKASNGASDFGNKFGQPLIAGSVLTFEHEEAGKYHGFDKVIMMAGGIGFGKREDSQKDKPEPGDKIVILGGDNYRIGMGGGAVSSVNTGEFSSGIELNAIQRSNPEMQKRAANAIRAMAELDHNPVVSIHDHGAGGHLNCLSELIEETGGTIDLDKLPVGDQTLSSKEIVGNESQERMGLVMKPKDIGMLQEIAERERAPMYVVGEATGKMKFTFKDNKGNQNPIDWDLSHMFGSSPKTILTDRSEASSFGEVDYDNGKVSQYLNEVLQLEAVACKDWLTNKVDRSVTGRVAMQQTCGEIQLPLNNLGVIAIDYRGKKGIATSIGHAPIAALINPTAGSQLSIAEALTNIIWAPLTKGLSGVSLSANWMWPAKNEGENARLYEAVEAVSDFACALGINIPTGKDSLSMTQKYPDGKTIYSPGTVIISAAGEVEDITKCVSPALKKVEGSTIIYIDLSKDSPQLGGSSFAQVCNKVGSTAPHVNDAAYFKNVFNTVQELIRKNLVLAGHDISSGGIITALAEMCFPMNQVGIDVNLDAINSDLVPTLFSENPGLLIQSNSEQLTATLDKNEIDFVVVGNVNDSGQLHISKGDWQWGEQVSTLRDTWFRTSYLLDKNQAGHALAKSRFENYKKQPLSYDFPTNFTGQLAQYNISQDRKVKSGIRAAIIREKGVNGDREMAYAMHLAGFDVKDVHMTDLISGRETLEDVNFIVFVGGFSNSDVLGSAKGWAGAFLYNKKAKLAIDNFYARPDTLSLGVCNGCQLMIELGLLFDGDRSGIKMEHNLSCKFESAFVNLTIPENNSVMLKTLSGSRLGVWLAHGEGKFTIDGKIENIDVAAKYSYSQYPGNPNDSDFDVASMASKDGRHLVMMPHLERSIFSWNWAHYPTKRENDVVSPWIEAFINAKEWVKSH